MKKVFAFLMAFGFLLAGCEEQTGETNFEQQEGIIADIKEGPDGRGQILLIPNMSEEELSNKNLDELIEIARGKGGAYYSFDVNKHEDLEIGVHIIAYWNGTELESHPPQRELEKVDVITK